MVTALIDTVYDSIMRISLRILRVYVDVDEVHEVPLELPTDEHHAPHTFKSVEEILSREAVPLSDASHNTVMYARGINVPLYRNPTVEFDSQIAVIPYGDIVMMLEAKGRFFHVLWNTREGWVLKDDLADRSAYVHPEFVIGEENLVDSPNTAHTRAILGDPFHTRNTDFPLQAGEYILYMLWKKNKRIDWPYYEEPRVPGLWHRILRGVPRIHIGVLPKVGAIMEYTIQGEIGHLAYVEAVFPDDTITVSEVNYPDSGIYNERVLTKDEWKELRPTFISVL